MTDSQKRLRGLARQLVDAGEWQSGFAGQQGDDDGTYIVSYNQEDIVNVAKVPSKLKRAYIIAAQPSAILELLAALERAEVDAARYRWLRAHGGPAIVLMPLPPDDMWCPSNEELDIAIDHELQMARLHAGDILRSTQNEAATLLGTPKHQIICQKCGADRTKEPCKNWRKHECAMTGTAQATSSEWKCPDCGNGQNFNHQGCKIHKLDAAIDAARKD